MRGHVVGTQVVGTEVVPEVVGAEVVDGGRVPIVLRRQFRKGFVLSTRMSEVK